MLPREENNGKAEQTSSGSDIGNQVRFSQATQGAAGECLSRAQRDCAFPPSEGRYGSGTPGSVEADTVCRKAIRSGASRVRIVRTSRVPAMAAGSGLFDSEPVVARYSLSCASSKPRTPTESID